MCGQWSHSQNISDLLVRILQVSSLKGESTEDKVLGLAQDVKEHLPELIDYDNTVRWI